MRVCFYVDRRGSIHLCTTIELNGINPIVCEGPRRWDEKQQVRLVGTSCPKLRLCAALVTFTSLSVQGAYEGGRVTDWERH